MKSKHLIQKLMGWIERLNNYPGCDQKTLNTRKIMWLGTAYALLYIIILALILRIIEPELFSFLMNSGYFLYIILSASLFISPRIKKHFTLLYTIQLILLMTGTFYLIIRLGGIVTSGGLIVACLAFVFSSFPLQNSRITITLFVIYTIVVILSGILTSWLTVPEQMTPTRNSTLSVFNVLSMSALSLYLVLGFFAQQRKLEELESNKLKELNEAKNKLFTNITHEFRTPLTIVQGMTNLIKTNPEEWIEKGTVKIETQTRNLLALVNQMLDLSKLEAGAMPLHCYQSDIIRYLKYLSESFASMAQKKGIRLSFVPETKHFVMDFDQEKIMYIVSNLLSNALKFTPCNGTVELYAGQLKEQNEFVCWIF
jgi:signal transduction histidine kinase